MSYNAPVRVTQKDSGSDSVCLLDSSRQGRQTMREVSPVTLQILNQLLTPRVEVVFSLRVFFFFLPPVLPGYESRRGEVPVFAWYWLDEWAQTALSTRLTLRCDIGRVSSESARVERALRDSRLFVKGNWDAIDD